MGKTYTKLNGDLTYCKQLSFPLCVFTIQNVAGVLPWGRKTQMLLEGEYCEILPPVFTRAYEMLTSEHAKIAKFILSSDDVCKQG